jgi:hypothetical protein
MYFRSDALLELNGLRDAVTGDYLNVATVTASIRDLKGNLVVGAENIIMEHVSSSNGDYRGRISHAANFVEGKQYVAEVTAIGDADIQGYWKLSFQVRRRSE